MATKQRRRVRVRNRIREEELCYGNYTYEVGLIFITYHRKID